MSLLIRLTILAALSSLGAYAAEEPKDYQELRRLRQEKIDDVDKKYVEALKKLKIRYTKKGDLDAALVIDAEIKTIVDNLITRKIGGGYGVPSTLAEVSSGRPKIIARTGTRLFSNRDYKFIAYPEKFSGWELDYIDGGSKAGDLKINVTKSGTVFLICNDADFVELEKDGWVKEAECSREPKKSEEKPSVIISKILSVGSYRVKSTSFMRTRLLTSPKK